jgi:CBS domain-containing protein
MRSYVACVGGLLVVMMAGVAGCGGGGHVRSAPRPVVPHAEVGAWSLCDGNGVDVARENEAAVAALAGRELAWGPSRFDVIVVPGFTPLDAATPTPVVHPTAAARLDAAMAFFRGGAARTIVVSGANVHPDGTPYVEAVLMKRYLLDHGVKEDAIVVEPCARHSHTNLRDVGRFMIRYGLERALVVTSRDQAFYFANPRMSGFEERCLADFGYRVGQFTSLPDATVEFRPAGDVFRRGSDPKDP